MRTRDLILASLTLLLCACGGGREGDQPKALFGPTVDTQPTSVDASSGTSSRVRRTRLSRGTESLFKSTSREGEGEERIFELGDRIHLNLFEETPNVAFDGVIKERRSDSPGRISVSGDLMPVDDTSAAPVGSFTLVSRNGVIAAHVVSNTGDYYILPDSGNLYKIEHRQFAVPTADDVVEPEGKPTTRTTSASPPVTLASSPQVDVLVVYTTNAERYAGGANKLKALVDLAEVETRQILANSRIDLTIKVVAIEKTTFTESASLGDDLDSIAFGRGGANARKRREDHRADIVTLIQYGGDGEGIAYLLEQPFELPYDRDHGFSVLRINDIVYRYDFTHELGHLFGCNHNRPLTGFYPFSRGHFFTISSKTFGTVLAYTGAANRIPYFSNPDVMYNGVPTGAPELLGSGAQNPNAADCARTIRATMAHLASYK